MPRSRAAIEAFLEIGQKKLFAGVFQWPGWYGSGRDEASALQALYEAGPRYQRALGGARLGFRAPADPVVFHVVERVAGNSATDYGVPNVPLARDAAPVEAAEIASEVGAKHLLFYHVIPPLPLPGLDRVFLEGVSDAYGGGVTLGRDGTFVSLPKGGSTVEVSQR